MQDFAGKHVVVTGGAGWLGTAVVAELLSRGAHVHIPALLPKEAERSPHWAHERVHGDVGVNLADAEITSRWFAERPPLWASLHVAGGFAMGAIADATAEQALSQFQVNALSCLLSCKGAVERIRAGASGGRIVNVAAGPGLGAGPGMLAYAMAKSAVVGLTRSLAEELRPERILVNAIVPGVMDTPTNRRAMPDVDPSDWSPLADVARALCNLASPLNGTTTGSFLHV